MIDDDKVTEEEVLENWPYYLTYLVEILNGEYQLKDAIEDIKSFRPKLEEAI